MLTKEKLIIAANEAKKVKAHVYIVKNKDGVEVLLKPVANYSSEEVASNPEIIKVIQPDSILKYNWTTWKLKDGSIDLMVDEINKEFGLSEIKIGSV
jgi:hypothetical protein